MGLIDPSVGGGDANASPARELRKAQSGSLEGFPDTARYVHVSLIRSYRTICQDNSRSIRIICTVHVAVARRSDPEYDYPITREWLLEVKAAIGTERGRQAQLAREIGCSPGTLNELLKDGKSSHLVPAISKALGISTTAMIVSRDTQEIVVFLEKMGPEARQKMRNLKQLDRSQLDLVLSMIGQMSKTKED